MTEWIKVEDKLPEAFFKPGVMAFFKSPEDERYDKYRFIRCPVAHWMLDNGKIRWTLEDGTDNKCFDLTHWAIVSDPRETK